MANTFIELNDTPSTYSGSGLRFARVNAAADSLVFGEVELNDLADIQANLAYRPSGGQALIYNSAVNKWRPGSMDVYSAGNGINKNALTLNVVAGIGGGLTSNSSGVFITDIANVAGTYGNASYVPIVTVNSKGQVTEVTPIQIEAEFATTITNPFVGNVLGTSGQIRVVGGTGNNSNAVIDLVATGVTAAVYGNSTHFPQITVDSYGRIQNVDLVEIANVVVGSSSNGNALGFANIVISGQTTVSAERPQDTLTFVAGNGSTITTNANADTINFGVNSAYVAGEISLDQILSGGNDGDLITWVAANNAWESREISNTGVTPGTYGSETFIPQLTVDAKGRITSVVNISAASHIQSLSWNSLTNRLTISGGNSVDLSSLAGSGGGSASNAFSTISVAGQSDVVATNEDTLTLVAGDGVSITTNATAQSVTISSIVNQGLDFGTFLSPAGFTLDMGSF